MKELRGMNLKPKRKTLASKNLRGNQGWRGQELVEFALTLPVLILFLVGVIDLGRIFHAVIVITNAAREGARYGSSQACNFTGSVFSCNVADIQARTRDEALSSGIVINPAQVQVINPNTNALPTGRGQPLRVNVRFNFQFLVSGVLPGTGLLLNRYNEMVIP